MIGQTTASIPSNHGPAGDVSIGVCTSEFASIVGNIDVLAGLPEVVPFHIRRSTQGYCHLIALTSASALSQAAAAGCEVARLDCDVDSEQPLLMPRGSLPKLVPPDHRLLFANDFFFLFAVPKGSKPVNFGRGTRTLNPDATLLSAEAETPGTLSCPHTVSDLELSFRVAFNEEHVEVSASFGRSRRLLPSRLYNYLLLTLARQRLADRERGVADEGWVFRDQLCTMLHCDQSRLNVDVFRIRRRFAVLPLIDPEDIIERRPDSKELRIGVHKLRIGRPAE